MPQLTNVQIATCVTDIEPYPMELVCVPAEQLTAFVRNIEAEIDRARQAPAPVEVSRLAEEAKELATEVQSRQKARDVYALWDMIDRLATMASTPASEVLAGSEDEWVARVNKEGLLVEREGVSIAEGSRLYLRAAPGWKLVPIEPTAEMLEAGVAAAVNQKNANPWCAPCYRAMLAATPASPATEGEAVEKCCQTCVDETEPASNPTCRQCGTGAAWSNWRPKLAAPIEAEAQKAEIHQPTNREDAEAGNVNAIRHVAYGEGYRDGKAAAAEAQKAVAPFGWAYESFGQPIDGPAQWFDRFEFGASQPEFTSDQEIRNLRPLYTHPTSSASTEAVAQDLLEFVQSLVDDYMSEDGMDDQKTIVKHAAELVERAKKNGWRLGGADHG